MSQQDPALVLIDDISQSIRDLVDFWYRVLEETESLVQALIRRLEAQQGRDSEARSERRATFSSRQTSAKTGTARHESESSTASRPSLKGIENLQQLLNQDTGRVTRRTTRSSTAATSEQRSAGGSESAEPTSPQAVDRRESSNVRTEEMQVVASQETGGGGSVASPPGSRSGRRRDVKAKTVVRENIAKMDSMIKQLQEIKGRMCVELACSTKGNQAYDAAAIEIDETVKKLESIGLRGE